MEDIRPYQHLGTAESVADANGLMAREGFQGIKLRNDARHQRRVVEAARLWADAIAGKVEPFLFKQALAPTEEIYVRHLAERYPGIFSNAYSDRIGLRETMTVSDFSALTVDVLDRVLYGYYTAAPITNMPLVKKVPLRDFRVVARYEVDGGTTPWSQVVPKVGTTQGFPTLPHAPGEPPTQHNMSQAAREVLGSTQRVTYAPQLYQGGMSVNWRAIVNDDLGIFNDMTNRLAIGGRRTIYQYITSLYCSSTGPSSTLYNSTFANLVTPTYGAASTNPALSFQGLLDAITVLAKQKDLDGQPITFDGQLYLVVGPALLTTATSMMKAVQADISVGGGTTNAQGFPSQRLRMENWPVQNMAVIEDKYLPITASSAAGSIAATQWYLFYDPNAQARPALELGFLTGFDTPQMYQKVPNTMRVGGGVDPMVGDFYSNDIEYKGCLVFGGTPIDGRSTVASTGAGS